MVSGGWDGRGDVGYNQEGAQWPAAADGYSVSVSADGADTGAARPERPRPAAYGTQPGMRSVVTASPGQAGQNVQRGNDPRYNVQRHNAPALNVARRSAPGHNVRTRPRPLPVHRARPMTARVLGPTWW